ncbi:MAG: cytochrome c3 family protein [Actinomycetes bacterium]
MKWTSTPVRLAGGIAAGAGLAFVGVVFLATSPASADAGPHVSTAGTATVDRCAGCHRAHSAKAANLLLVSEVSLCTTCHGTAGTGAITDVMGGVAYNNTAAAPNTVRGTTVAGALRSGGFTTSRIASATVNLTNKTVGVAAASATSTSAHSIDGSLQKAWGLGALGTAATGSNVSLMCTSCHDPHGNGNYRILRPIPTGSGATGITIADSTGAKVYTTTNYWSTAPTDTGASTAYITNVSQWCSTCHTRYLAGSGAADAASGDATFSFRHMSSDNTAGGPNCITCHVSHGSNASMTGESGNVLNPDGAGAGSSRLLRIDNRGTCEMCHNK